MPILQLNADNAAIADKRQIEAIIGSLIAAIILGNTDTHL
jgi:hypothetical protein